MLPRVMVSPSLFALSDALASASGEPRAEWQERLADALRDADGDLSCDEVRLAWWTGPGGKRHFRIGSGQREPEDGPAVRGVYPERCFWRMIDHKREWVMACPCGAVVPPDRWAGTRCVDCDSPPAVPTEWPEPDLAVHVEGKRLLVRRASTGETLLDRSEGDALNAVRLADDGRSLAAATDTEVLLWRMDDEAGVLRLAHVLQVAEARALAFASNGSLAMASRGSLVFFDGQDHRLLWTQFCVYNHSARPVAMGFLPEGTRIVVAATGEGAAIVCDLDVFGWGAAETVQLPGLAKAWLSPDARRLAWTANDDGVALHDLSAGVRHERAGWSPDEQVGDVRFVDGGLLLRHDDGSVAHLPMGVFPPPKAFLAVEVPPPLLPVAPPLPAPPPATSPSLDASTETMVWELRLLLMEACSGLPQRLAAWAALSSPHRHPEVEPVLAEILRSSVRNPDRVSALAVSPESDHFAWADGEAVRLVRVSDEKKLFEYPLLQSGLVVRSLAFSPDGLELAFAGANLPVVLDIEYGDKPAAPFLHRGQEVWSVAFSLDGLHLYAVETHKGLWHHVSRWSWRDGRWREAESIAVPGMRRGWVSRIGRYLAWSDGEPGLVLTDLRDRRELGRLEGAGLGDVQSVRFLDDWRLVAVGGDGRAHALPWRDRLGF